MMQPAIAEVRAGVAEVAHDMARDLAAGIPFDMAVGTLHGMLPVLFTAAETRLMLAVAIVELGDAIRCQRGGR